MSKKPKTPLELPSGGGSYTRNPDGSLNKPEPPFTPIPDQSELETNNAS